MHGMVDPPTTQICFWQRIRSSVEMLNFTRTSGPVRHMVALLSGKTFKTHVLWLCKFLLSRVMCSAISSGEFFGVKLTKMFTGA